MGEKHELGKYFTVASLNEIYEQRKIAHICTDGVYVQIEKEPQDCSPKANKKINLT